MMVSGIEDGSLAVEIRRFHRRERDLMAAQEILRLDARQTKHFGQLVERQSPVAVALNSERFEGVA